MNQKYAHDDDPCASNSSFHWGFQNSRDSWHLLLHLIITSFFPPEAVLATLIYKGFPPHPQERPHPRLHQPVPITPTPTWLGWEATAQHVWASTKGRGLPVRQVLPLDLSENTPIKTGTVFARQLLQDFSNHKCHSQEQFSYVWEEEDPNNTMAYSQVLAPDELVP